VLDVAGEARADPVRRRAIDLAMVDQGVFINPMLTKIYVSLAHDDADLDRFISALTIALVDTQSAG
jgi:glutamate-1-semialdehyde aminotransferase